MFRFQLNNGTTTKTVKEPKNFADVQSVVTRDFEVHGLFFEYTDSTIQLGFPCDHGREFLEDEFQENGPDADVTFTIDELNKSTNTYTNRFTGKIDFQTRTFDKNYFNCDVIRIDFLEKLNNRKDQTINLLSSTSLEGNAIGAITPLDTRLHGRRFYKIARYEANELAEVRSVERQVGGQLLDKALASVSFPYQIQNSNIDNTKEPIPGIIYLSEANTLYDPFYISANPDLPRKQPRRMIDFEGRIHFDYTSTKVSGNDLQSNTYNVKIGVSDSDFNVRYEEPLAIVQFETNTTKTVNRVFTFQAVLQESELVFIRLEHISGQLVGEGDDVYDVTIDLKTDSYLDLQEPVVKESTEVDLYYPFDAINKALEIITDENDKLQSDFFTRPDGCGSMTSITNGYEIRNFDKAFSVSFEDIFKSFSALYNIGFGVEGEKVRMEPFKYFYGDEEMFDMTNLPTAEYEEENFDDLLFNKVKIGYSKFANDESKEETINDYNTEHQYFLPYKKISQTKDIISPGIASGELIESTREENFKSKPTESFKHDDELFLVKLYEDTLNDEETVFFIQDVIDDPNDATEQRILIKDGTEPVLELLQDRFTPLDPNDPLFLYIYDNDGNSHGFFEALSVEYANVATTQSDYIEIYNFVPEIDIATPNDFNQGGYITIVTQYATNDYPERDQNFSSVTGIPYPEYAYNLRLSPKRMLLNWGWYLNSVLAFKNETTAKYKNTFAKINGDLQTELEVGDSCIIGDTPRQSRTENKDVLIEDVYDGNKILEPVLVKFTVGLCQDDIKFLRNGHENALTGTDESKNYGYISVKDNDGNTQQGYLKEMKYNIGGGPVEMTLIKKFIAYDVDWFNTDEFD